MQPKYIPDKLPGTVIQQYVKCGNPACHCAHGRQHGPYWYRWWRDEAGKAHKDYVRKADLEAVRAACAARQAEEAEVRRAIVLCREGFPWMFGYGDDPPLSDAAIDFCLRPLWATDTLCDAGVGLKGTVLMQIRAAEIVFEASVYLLRRREQEYTASLIGLRPAPAPWPDDDDELPGPGEWPIDPETGKPILDDVLMGKVLRRLAELPPDDDELLKFGEPPEDDEW